MISLLNSMLLIFVEFSGMYILTNNPSTNEFNYSDIYLVHISSFTDRVSFYYPDGTLLQEISYTKN